MFQDPKLTTKGSQSGTQVRARTFKIIQQTVSGTSEATGNTKRKGFEKMPWAESGEAQLSVRCRRTKAAQFLLICEMTKLNQMTAKAAPTLELYASIIINSTFM